MTSLREVKEIRKDLQNMKLNIVFTWIIIGIVIIIGMIFILSTNNEIQFLMDHQIKLVYDIMTMHDKKAFCDFDNQVYLSNCYYSNVTYLNSS